MRVKNQAPGADPNDPYLLQLTERKFSCFSQKQPGWGFPEFLSIPVNVNAIAEDGSVSIDISVAGPQTVHKGSIEYRQELEITSSTETLPFGPKSCSWRLELTKNETSLACHLSMCLSDFEKSVGDVYSRNISALTVCLLDVATGESIASKSITGGYTFTSGGRLAGWENFIDLSLIDALQFVVVSVTVTWDPQV